MPYGGPCGKLLEDVIASDNGSGNQRFLLSRDGGITWEALFAPITVRGVAFGAAINRFVAMGGASGKVAYTSNPSLWEHTVNLPAGAPTGVGGVAWSPLLGLFAAVAGTNAGSGMVVTSPDGLVWTVRATPAPDRVWRFIMWVPELAMFIAGSSGAPSTGSVMTSTDGITWVQRLTGTGVNCSVGAWSGTVALMTGPAGTGPGVLRSTDAITWTHVAIPGAAVNLTGIAWSRQLHLFVAVTQFGSPAGKQICLSSDGLTWVVLSSGVTGQWQDLVWLDSMQQFVATGRAAPFFMTSPDGKVWTGQTVSPTATGNSFVFPTSVRERRCAA